MNALAQIPNGAQPARHRRISKRLANAVELLVTGEAKTIKDAAHQVGMTRSSLSVALSKPHVQEFRKHRHKHAIDNLESLSIGALTHLLAHAESEHVRKDIALKVVGRYITPDAGGNTINITNVGQTIGLNIDLTPPDATGNRTADDAKPLIEHEDVTDDEG